MEKQLTEKKFKQQFAQVYILFVQIYNNEGITFHIQFHVSRALSLCEMYWPLQRCCSFEEDDHMVILFKQCGMQANSHRIKSKLATCSHTHTHTLGALFCV